MLDKIIGGAAGIGLDPTKMLTSLPQILKIISGLLQGLPGMGDDGESGKANDPKETEAKLQQLREVGRQHPQELAQAIRQLRPEEQQFLRQALTSA